MNLSFLPKFQKILASLIISEFRRLSQEDLEFGASWVYIARPSLLTFTHTYTNPNLEYWCSYYPLKIILLSAFLFPDISILCFLILFEIRKNLEKLSELSERNNFCLMWFLCTVIFIVLLFVCLFYELLFFLTEFHSFSVMVA